MTEVHSSTRNTSAISAVPATLEKSRNVYSQPTAVQQWSLHSPFIVPVARYCACGIAWHI